jgi:TorA maturation chaperone TorD
MSAATARVELHRPLPPEEAARADFYALLARMAYAAPDAPLLASLAQAEPIPSSGDGELSRAWEALSRASSAMDADAAAEEYEALFVGMGKAPVSLYAGHYLGAPAADHPRVRLQADFAAFGLGLREDSTEPEDHFAALFEVMRVLVAGGKGREPATLAEQKRFFEAFLARGARALFDAVTRAEKANYYRRVAGLGVAFLAIEAESFELD